MSTIDYLAEAKVKSEAATHISHTDPQVLAVIAEGQLLAAIAQAEATAALVEQHRVRNLIELFHLEDADVSDLGTRGVIWPQVSEEIVAGLGLA